MSYAEATIPVELAGPLLEVWDDGSLDGWGDEVRRDETATRHGVVEQHEGQRVSAAMPCLHCGQLAELGQECLTCLYMRTVGKSVGHECGVAKTAYMAPSECPRCREKVMADYGH